MKAGADRLRAPAGSVVRAIALRHLSAARAAAVRLHDDADTEALHDLRVALRRLRSTLRAHRPYLEHRISRGLRRRWRALARATNDARDTEVQLDWLSRVQHATPAERAACQWWRARLERARTAAYDETRAIVAARFGKLDQRLRGALATDAPPARDSDVTFARAVGERAIEYAAALADDLASIDSADDYAAIHAARVDGKRLRYLLEPLAKESPAVARLVGTLKRLQDRFGAVCDAHVRRRALGQALAAATDELPVAAGNADPRPGLLALARRVEDEIGELYEQLAHAYLQRRTERLLAPFTALGRRLARSAAPVRPTRRARALQSKRTMSTHTRSSVTPRAPRRRRRA